MNKEIINTTTFVSYAKDFEGNENWTWQKAYFTLLSWKNTWRVPLKMDICSTGDHEAYLYMVLPTKRAKRTKDYLDELGYRNIHENEGKTVKVYIEWQEDYDECVIDFE